MRTRSILTIGAFVVAAWIAPVNAQQFQTSEQIVQGLSVTNTGPTVRSLSNVAKRGIDVSGKLPPMMDLPKVALTVNFELGSANLTVDGMIALRSLAKALHNPKLKGMTFQIAGHTDGRGDAAFNQKLSEARAATVVEHLTAFYEVPGIQLIPIGYGFSQPMDPANLLNPLNRRVEVINLEPLS